MGSHHDHLVAHRDDGTLLGRFLTVDEAAAAIEADGVSYQGNYSLVTGDADDDVRAILAAELDTLEPGRQGGAALVYRADAHDRVDALAVAAARALAGRLDELRTVVAQRSLSIADLAGLADLVVAASICADLHGVIEAPAPPGSFDLISPRDREADRERRAVLRAELARLDYQAKVADARARAVEAERRLAELETPRED